MILHLMGLDVYVGDFINVNTIKTFTVELYTPWMAVMTDQLVTSI